MKLSLISSRWLPLRISLMTLLTALVLFQSNGAFAEEPKQVTSRRVCEAEAIRYWAEALRGAYGDIRPLGQPELVNSANFSKNKKITLVGSAEVQHQIRKVSMTFRQWGSILLNNQCFFSRIEKHIAPNKHPIRAIDDIAMLTPLGP